MQIQSRIGSFPTRLLALLVVAPLVLLTACDSDDDSNPVNGDDPSVEIIPDTRQRVQQGDVTFENNAFFDIGAGSDFAGIVDFAFNPGADVLPADSSAEGVDDGVEQIIANLNIIADPQFGGVSRTTDGGLDPRPTNTGLPSPTAKSNFTNANGTDLGSIDDVSYHGAFEPGQSLWTAGWTALSQMGYTGDQPATLPSEPAQTQVVTDDISSDATWSSDTMYILNGLVFVDPGVTLTIEPGTIVKARLQGDITGEDAGRASALIVRRGGTLIADGQPDSGIIFTSTADDVSDADDTDETQRGLWGGVILLGSATTNQPTTNNQIEGVPDTEAALFGGDDNTDGSGTLRYVSIRHGGFSISGESGDEINGLTMGAQGTGTTIEFVEVFANEDDGFEWFGGVVHTNNLVAAFCGDDAYDYDQGFRGTGQFWFAVQGTDGAGRGGEHDGGDAGGDAAEPFARPVVSNATYIGPGSGNANGDDAIRMRDNAGGEYYNSIFAEFPGRGLVFEDIREEAN